MANKSANDEMVVWNNTQFRLSDITDDEEFLKKLKKEGVPANKWYGETKAAIKKANAEAAKAAE